jgi:hypothetical protein
MKRPTYDRRDLTLHEHARLEAAEAVIERTIGQWRAAGLTDAAIDDLLALAARQAAEGGGPHGPR